MVVGGCGSGAVGRAAAAQVRLLAVLLLGHRSGRATAVVVIVVVTEAPCTFKQISVVVILNILRPKFLI